MHKRNSGLDKSVTLSLCGKQTKVRLFNKSGEAMSRVIASAMFLKEPQLIFA